MSQLQDLQFPIDRAIFAEVLACLPKTWTRAKLTASVQSGSEASSSMTIRIDGLGQTGIALVSDALQGRMRELFLLNKRFDTGLRGIEYTYERQPDGRWSFVADYKRMNSRLASAFDELLSALTTTLPELVAELRPPIEFSADFLDRPGAEQLHDLWSLTSGQRPGNIGILGGLRLLGPIESQVEMKKWLKLMTSGVGREAVANPVWDSSRSRDPNAVRAVYFAAGWIPLLSEPNEANYLAVDLVPLPSGRLGQMVLCGRDEDEKCVVSPDLASLLQALATECRSGAWQLRAGNPDRHLSPSIQRRGGRLLSACKQREFPPQKFVHQASP